MRPPAPRFDLALLASEIAARGAGLGEPAHHAPETGSTNDDALAAARAGAPHGSLFVADQQRAGRGRLGRRWRSDPGGGLLFSLVLRPERPDPAAPLLTLAAGLAVRAALAEVARDRLWLKWPNDVTCRDRKLSGILCEGVLEGARLTAVVVGVGVNLAPLDAVPPGAERLPVSLAELSPSPLPRRERLLARILSQLHARAPAALGGDESASLELVAEFRRHDALAGRRVRVDGERGPEGVARGIDARGRLLLETGSGTVAVQSGTLRAL